MPGSHQTTTQVKTSENFAKYCQSLVLFWIQEGSTKGEDRLEHHSEGVLQRSGVPVDQYIRFGRQFRKKCFLAEGMQFQRGGVSNSKWWRCHSIHWIWQFKSLLWGQILSLLRTGWEVTPSCWEVQVVLFNWSEGQGETGPLTEVERWR